jgi:hypothetical protein
VRLRLLFAIASLSISVAQGGAILFSNITGTPLGAGLIEGSGISAGSYLAAAFEFTPTGTGTLTDAVVDIWKMTIMGGLDSDVTVSIYSDNAGRPGTLLVDINTESAPTFASWPVEPFSSIATTFTQASGPAVTLTAGTAYWLVLSPGDANSVAVWAGGDGITAPLPWSSQSGTSTSPWSAPSTVNFEFQVDSAASTTPEPSSLGLFAVGVFVLFGVCHFRTFLGRREARSDCLRKGNRLARPHCNCAEVELQKVRHCI